MIATTSMTIRIRILAALECVAHARHFHCGIVFLERCEAMIVLGGRLHGCMKKHYHRFDISLSSETIEYANISDVQVTMCNASFHKFISKNYHLEPNHLT